MKQGTIKKALKREAKIAFDSGTPGRLIHSTAHGWKPVAGGLGKPPVGGPRPRWTEVIITHIHRVGGCTAVAMKQQLFSRQNFRI